MGKGKRKNTTPYVEEPDSDENFQYIAGYTEGGVPFGITWEEAELIEEQEKQKASMQNDEVKNCENPVDLIQLIDAFDAQSDYLFFYVNRTSGEIRSLMEPDEPEQDDESGFDRSVIESDEYIPLPSRWEINRYEILKQFISSLESSKMKEVLAHATKGKGAFGRFHTAIHTYKIQDQWYKYLKDRLHEKAIEWCHQNKLAYK